MISAPAQKCFPSAVKINTLRYLSPSKSTRDEFLDTLLSVVHSMIDINSPINSVLSALKTSLLLRLILATAPLISSLHNLFSNNDKDKAEDLFDIYLPLIRHEQQFGIGLGLRKFVLQKRGIIKSLNVRSPGPVLTEDDVKEMNYLLKRLLTKLNEKGLPIPKGIN